MNKLNVKQLQAMIFIARYIEPFESFDSLNDLKVIYKDVTIDEASEETEIYILTMYNDVEEVKADEGLVELLKNFKALGGQLKRIDI